jgi:ribonuclease E
MGNQEQENTLLVSITGDKLHAAWISENRKITNLHTENLKEPQSYRGSFCLAKITRVEPALSAYFVSYLGNEFNARQGFLPWKETHPELQKNLPYVSHCREETKTVKNGNNTLTVGQTILIQISRDERGTKGAALTTFYSIPGSYLVLMPNNPTASGISRKAEGSDRDTAKQIISQLQTPEHVGIILRTAGLDRSKEELQWDLDNLLEQWKAIQQTCEKAQAPTLIYQGESGFKRIIRDQLAQNTIKIIVDNSETYQEIREYTAKFRPYLTEKIEHYTSSVPLFTHYQIQQQIESTYLREVILSSGATIVIDRTEALYAIDVNSGKSIKGANIEETALKTNLEAVDEITCQLKLRDIGGLIVIDFIDMKEKADREKVQDKLIKSLKTDSAKTHICEISKLGLLEMSRQRLHPSLGDTHLIECPTCQKRGYVRSIPSFSESLLHLIEENAVNTQHTTIQIQVPVQVANYLWNNQALAIQALEQKHHVEIIIIANPDYNIPKYQLKRLKQEGREDGEGSQAYESTQALPRNLDTQYTTKYQNPITQQAHLIQHVSSTHPHTQIGLFTRLWKSIFTQSTPTSTTQQSSRKIQQTQSSTHQQQRRKKSTPTKQRSAHTNTSRTSTRSSTSRPSTRTSTSRSSTQSSTSKPSTRTDTSRTSTQSSTSKPSTQRTNTRSSTQTGKQTQHRRSTHQRTHPKTPTDPTTGVTPNADTHIDDERL